MLLALDLIGAPRYVVAGKQTQGSCWFCIRVSCILILLHVQPCKNRSNTGNVLESSQKYTPPSMTSLVPERLGTTVVKANKWDFGSFSFLTIFFYNFILAYVFIMCGYKNKLFFLF